VASLDKYPPIRSLCLSAGRWQPQLDTLQQALAQATSAADIERGLEGIMRTNGAQMCGYLALMPDGAATRACWADTALSSAFTPAYVEQRMYRTDPVVLRGHHEVLPIPWGLREQRRRMTIAEKALYGLLDDHKIYRGVAVPIHGPVGYSVLGVMIDDNERDFRRRLPTLAPTIHLIASHVHATVMGKFMAKEGTAPTPPRLTRRETECLSWSAEGLVAHEIGDRMGIAESTVQFHLENCRRKLSARTLTQAVANAIGWNLIHL